MKKTLMTLSMLAAGAVAAPAMAADCSVTIEGNDQMQYNIKSVEVPKSCKTFTMNLKHVGKMPKSSMGHNIVLTTSADFTATAKDSLTAGAAKDYVKDGDTRIIAHTNLIGGGESPRPCSLMYPRSRLVQTTPTFVHFRAIRSS